MKSWREGEKNLELQLKRHCSTKSNCVEDMAGAEDALAYLKLVRETDENKFKEFLRILGEYQSKSISTKALVSVGKTLFRAHPQLLLGLNKFLPKEHNIDTAAVEEEVGEELRRKVEMQRALAFVNKVKVRFCKEEHVYNKFMAVLNLYKQAGARIDEVALQISSLFVGHRDLMEDFTFFLPPSAKPKPLPSAARRPILQANLGQHDKANGTSRVQEMHSKEAGKRATSPTDGHGGGQDLSDGVLNDSPPKVKKQRRQTDEDEEVVPVHVEVVPRHSCPMFKKQRTSIDTKEDEKNKTDHSGNQGFTNQMRIQSFLLAQNALPVDPAPLTLEKQWKKTGRVEDETDRTGRGDCEYPKAVREKIDTHACQKVHGKDSPPEARMQPRKTDTDEEKEKDTTHDSQTKESAKDAREQLNVRLVRTWPPEYSPTKIRQQNRTDRVEREIDTSCVSGNKESAKEGVEQLNVRASQEHPPPKNMQRETDKVHEEAKDTTHDSQSEHSAKALGEQLNVRVSQKLPQEHSPTKTRRQRKRTDRAEDENDTAHESGGRESLKEGREQIDVVMPQKLSPEHPLPEIRKQQQKGSGELEEENDATTKEQRNVRVTPKLPQEASPSKSRKQQNKTDAMGDESHATRQSGRKESFERGKQTHICDSQKLTQEHPSLKIRKQQKKTGKVEERKDTTNQSESSDSAKELGKRMSVFTAENLPREYSPVKIGKQRRTNNVEEEHYAKHESGNMVSAEDTGGQINVSALQKSFQQLWLPEIQIQQSEEEETDDTTHQSVSEDSSQEVGEEADAHALQKLPTEWSPNEIRKQNKKADAIEEEDVIPECSLHKVKNQPEKDKKDEESDQTDQTGSEESEKETGKETAVDTSQKVPQKRSSARLAHEVIRKQSQAAATGLVVHAQSTFRLLEEEQKIIRFQQLEDKKSMLMQQRQHKLFEKIKETVEGSHTSISLTKSLVKFSEEIMSCPELQALVTEVLEEQDLDYSECKKCTASYYLLPKSYLKPLTTCRSDSDRELLNDSWVSAGYDHECKENLHDEFNSGSCKQIGREIGSKRVPHDRRLYHEEKLSLCEDDQFELDLLRQTTANTIEKLARMMEETQAPHFCMQKFDWGEYLSLVNFRCIERIYGDHGTEFIQEAQKSPVISLPIILDRLKQKEEEEWPKYQVKMNKSWAEVHTKHYHKSLDYSRSNGKQSEKLQLCIDSFPTNSELNEDDEDDSFVPAADGERKHSTPVLSCAHPDIEVMFNVLKFLLEEVNMTKEQFNKVQTIWSMHFESVDGILGNAQGDGNTE